MSDFVPANEFNILKNMPALQKQIVKQRGQFCWAIAVATVVGYRYHIRKRMDYEFEVSPQDIAERIWYYYPGKRKKEQDSRGYYKSDLFSAYDYVHNRGAGLLKNYPFENRLNENKGGIKSTEFPRIFCEGFKKLSLNEAVAAIKRSEPITAAVRVTMDFINLKKGIYKKPSTAAIDKEDFGKHAVVIIGVNEEQRYFRIRNSWGFKWGNRGYGKIDFDSIGNFTCGGKCWKEFKPKTVSV